MFDQTSQVLQGPPPPPPPPPPPVPSSNFSRAPRSRPLLGIDRLPLNLTASYNAPSHANCPQTFAERFTSAPGLSCIENTCRVGILALEALGTFQPPLAIRLQGFIKICRTLAPAAHTMARISLLSSVAQQGVELATDLRKKEIRSLIGKTSWKEGTASVLKTALKVGHAVRFVLQTLSYSVPKLLQTSLPPFWLAASWIHLYSTIQRYQDSELSAEEKKKLREPIAQAVLNAACASVACFSLQASIPVCALLMRWANSCLVMHLGGRDGFDSTLGAGGCCGGH